MKIQCRECRKEFEVPVTESQVHDWQGGGLIQRVMPHLTGSQRQLLMTRTCGECFDKMFVSAE